MRDDEESTVRAPQSAGLLRPSGLSYLLRRLADEAAILDLPLTGEAILTALLMCRREGCVDASAAPEHDLPLPSSARTSALH